ncbi:putative zinc-binding protein [Pseudobacteroides cellulosolvens]|uniref:DGC domain protein n=1 Tax=Pseudobacteroides cellulosolvens ATCC 35603 = DSM 2933 TaxID=398512 RepID=A0A0L6JWS5_9FIRM|nr:putative zinc-binding protein [Pseudobacteroides cellulosolvens]KNY30301.1 DGC domain protein [Pseudobacteroides cellulosolvens ATCC 35603 = DSM 2933]
MCDSMNKTVSCCDVGNCESSNKSIINIDYEVINIEKTKNVCSLCEDYAKEQSEKPIVIMSCEGACLRGEVSRRAANIICHSLLPEKTVRLCLGGAFTKDGGQRNLVRNSKKVVALEGCLIKCASRMMKGVISDLNPDIIITDKLFSFDTNIFGINEMPEEDIAANSLEVAKKIAEKL